MAKLKLPDPKQAERLAKVTGEPLPKAPPAQEFPNIPGFVPPPRGMKLRPGQVVEASEESSHFTATEQAGLATKGWTPKSDVKPDEVADVIELLEAQAAMPPDGLTPDRPKTPYEIKDYAEGTPEQRKAFDDAVAQVRKQREADAEKASRAANLHPSVKAAVQLANQIEVEDDLDEKAKKAFFQLPTDDAKTETPDSKVETPDSKVETPDSKSETGAETPVSDICGNCGHDRRIEAIQELPAADRENFLLSLMSGQAYRKAYLLFNGKVEIHFRNLTTNELDACFRASSYRLRLEGGDNVMDIMELTRRYRLCLQFQEMHVSLAQSSLNASAPDGLCRELAPGAQDVWASEADGEMPKLTAERDKWLYNLLERIYLHLQDSVIKQESMMRIVFKQMNQFNREVKWLEDRADDPNFLQPAEKQP